MEKRFFKYKFVMLIYLLEVTSWKSLMQYHYFVNKLFFC